jgi:putative flavoprotein involved in K+ transport
MEGWSRIVAGTTFGGRPGFRREDRPKEIASRASVTLRRMSEAAPSFATGSEARQDAALEAHQAIVIGAGPAGLAAAASLQRERIETVVLEQASIGSSWRNHYDRLHLHTVRWLSGLPGVPIDRREGRWVSRDGVVRYLERYARHHDLNIRTDFEVERVIRHDGGWLLRTSQGEMHAHHLVLATGFNREPFLPDWPGREGFTGDLLHSAAYRNPSSYRGRDVLVVGTGNSAPRSRWTWSKGAPGR